MVTHQLSFSPHTELFIKHAALLCPSQHLPPHSASSPWDAILAPSTQKTSVWISRSSSDASAFVALGVSPPEVPRVLCTCVPCTSPSSYFYAPDSQAALTSLRQVTSFWSLLASPTERMPHATLPSCCELQWSLDLWNAGRVKVFFGIKDKCELKSVLEPGEEQKWHE